MPAKPILVSFQNTVWLLYLEVWLEKQGTMSRTSLNFLIASLFLTREEVKTLVTLFNIDIWDLLYCLGSLLPRKHLADNALQRTIKRHVSTIAAHSITAGSLSSRSPSPHDTVGSTALNKRNDYWQADNIMQRGPFYTSYSEVLEIKILNAKPSIFVMAFSGFHA